MKILVVVDMQNDFIDGALGTPEAQAIVPKVKAKIEAARANGDRIIFTRDTHDENYLNTMEGKKLPIPHCIKDTYGWEISSELCYNGFVIDKKTFGSFYLAEELYDSYCLGQEEFNTNVEEIEFVGLCTDICVISNVMMAKGYLPDMKITVDASCCAGVTPESHKNALEAMKMCHIDIIGE